MKPYTASLTQQADALSYDLRQRVDPAYAAQRGTESYELRQRVQELRQRVQELEQALALSGKVSEKLAEEIGQWNSVQAAINWSNANDPEPLK